MVAFDLRMARRRAKLRQTDLARELGFNSETVIDIDAGRIGIDEATYQTIRETIDRIAAARSADATATATN